MIEHFHHQGESVKFAVWLSCLLALGAFLGVRTSSVEATHTAETSFAAYSYAGSSCPSISDPIGVVFTFGNGSHSEVYDHAKLSSHGGWESRVSSDQYFWEPEYGCTANDNWAASNNGVARDRYHMRYEVDWNAETGQTSASTPHFDDFDERDVTHCIRPGPPSGFTQGVDDIYDNWYLSGLHATLSWVWWGNTTLIQKCHTWAWDSLYCGCWYPTGWEYAGGDGWVAYIKMQGAS